MIRYYILMILGGVFFSTCTTSRPATGGLSHFFDRESLFKDHFTGFMLYDLSSGKDIYEYHSQHLFTPASNTKILTLFASLKTLLDSIPSLQYAQRDDSIHVWGLGDPTILNPEFSNEDAGLDFIGRFNKPVVFCLDNFQTTYLGDGWAWDDYLYSYQAEKSSLPVFGNLLHINYDTVRKEQVLLPGFCQVDLEPGTRYHLQRDLYDNRFTIEWPIKEKALTLRTPLHITDTLIQQVLNRYVNEGVRIAATCPDLPQKKIKYGIPLDTIYSALMQHSNNFIAEQLLLAVSFRLTGTLDTHAAIEKIKVNYLNEIDPDLQWYDGSGLSRYNQFTPRTIVRVLKSIYEMLTEDQIKKIFPAGGQSGTIQNWYANENGPPYIYAKTGTLKNVHCLSGFIFTNSGRTLIFSFMHNNFRGPSSQIKKNMHEVLRYIKINY